VITGSISGSATVKGISATIPAQTITLTASATCKAGTGTLTLSTSPITVSLSTGTQATIAAQTLTVTANPVKATISDGTVVSTSQCTVTVSSPSGTSLGAAICGIQNLICQLADLLATNGSVTDAVTFPRSTAGQRGRRNVAVRLGSVGSPFVSNLIGWLPLDLRRILAVH
jgi:hypothetical protein